jgi:hypothetical protein
MMTVAQQSALIQIEDLMREHFDAGVAVLRAEEESNDLTENTEIVWHGGFAHAIGLLKVGEKKMFKPKAKKEKPQ